MSEDAPAPVEHPFSVGDIVELTKDALLARWKRGQCTPFDLWSVGWPNRFRVVGTVWRDKDPLVAIDACCRWMTNRATGAFLCGAHPASIFRRIPKERMKDAPRKADRKMSVSIPGVGDLSLDWFDDEHGQEFVMQGGNGRPMVVSGPIAKWMFETLKDGGVV